VFEQISWLEQDGTTDPCYPDSYDWNAVDRPWPKNAVQALVEQTFYPPPLVAVHFHYHLLPAEAGAITQGVRWWFPETFYDPLTLDRTQLPPLRRLAWGQWEHLLYRLGLDYLPDVVIPDYSDEEEDGAL
jgi:hypothetical protein